jgi:hypothetical protein
LITINVLNVTKSDARCTDTLGATGCQLRARHESAHAARAGGALVSWANAEAGDRGKLIVLDWFGG